VIAIWKPKQPNWEHNEVIALIQAKNDDHMASLDVVDSRDCFTKRCPCTLSDFTGF